MSQSNNTTQASNNTTQASNNNTTSSSETPQPTGPPPSQEYLNLISSAYENDNSNNFFLNNSTVFGPKSKPIC